MANSLKLGGDLDDVELVMKIERCFGFKFENDETERCVTVGDLYDRVLEHLPAGRERRTVCLSAVVFHRLKRAARDVTARQDLRPSTLVSCIKGKQRDKIFWRELAHRSGLELPKLDIGPLSILVFLLMFSAPLPAFAILESQIAVLFIASTFLSFVLLKVVPCYVPTSCKTMAGLTRQTLAINYGALAREYDCVDPKDAWEALISVIRICTGCEIEITRDTTFF